jgi:hypothetical protein
VLQKLGARGRGAPAAGRWNTTYYSVVVSICTGGARRSARPRKGATDRAVPTPPRREDQRECARPLGAPTAGIARHPFFSLFSIIPFLAPPVVRTRVALRPETNTLKGSRRYLPFATFHGRIGFLAARREGGGAGAEEAAMARDLARWPLAPPRAARKEKRRRAARGLAR